MAKFAYYFDFIAAPVVSVLLCLDHPGLRLLWLFPAGWALWTLVENVLHRLSHQLKSLRVEHFKHHRWPVRFNGPYWTSIVIYAVIYAGLFALIGHAASGFVAGLLAGYSVYLYIHNAIHRTEISKNSWIYSLALYHERHHAGAQGHFGVSTKIWDRILK